MFNIPETILSKFQAILTAIDYDLFIEEVKINKEFEYRVLYRTGYYSSETYILVGKMCSKGVYNYRSEYRKTNLNARQLGGLQAFLEMLTVVE